MVVATVDKTQPEPTTRDVLASIKRKLEEAKAAGDRFKRTRIIGQPESTLNTVLLSSEEMVNIIKLIDQFEEVRVGNKSYADPVGYINAIKGNGDDSVSLDLSDDLLFLILKSESGETWRALLDSGASISGVASRIRKDKAADWARDFEPFVNSERKDERTVIYANSQKGSTGNTLENVTFSVAESDEKTSVPTLYEMPLPTGIDLLLGLDWFKAENPLIDWQEASLKLSSGGIEHNGADYRARVERWSKTNSVHVVKSKPAAGEISQKAMRRIMKRNPSRVTCVRVQDSQQSSSAAHVMHTQTLVRKRLEAILQRAPTDDETEKEQQIPKDQLLFTDVRKTHIPELDEELKKSDDIILPDIDGKIIKTINENKLRRETLEMPIDLIDEPHKIPYRPYRRLSHREEEECTKIIEKYIRDGIIQPSNSPYGAAVLFAPKKNGKLRFCVDWRPLNNVTKKNSAHPPDTSDCLAQLTGSKIWSTLDAAQGYHQCPIRAEDMHKTAFNTRQGHWEYRQMSFGLSCAPAVYVQAMNQIFSGEAFRAGKATAYISGASVEERARQIESDPKMAELAENLLQDCVCIYIDDILIHSKNEKDHVEHVRKVLNRLRAYQLFLKAEKCFFARKEVEYLGHKITPEGITVCDDKVESVKTWPQPKTVGDIRQFLGLCGFYRKFIKGYGQTAKPLTDLTKKEASDDTGALHEFGEEQQTAFETLKAALCSNPVLALPDRKRGKFHVMCDASTYGLGAALFQEGEEDGKMHPCAYISRVLSAQERKDYATERKCIYELELRALIYALEKWKQYFDGQT